jgi:hypothetical protein
MKRYKELTASINKCNYCGSLVVLLDDIGQCPHGCPGNMHEVLNDSYWIDLKTGRLEYSIAVDKRDIEMEAD